jgi:hypothetical protein
MEMPKPHFAHIWSAILAQAGQTFTTKTNLPFTYQVSGDVLAPSRTDYRISRSDFEVAYDLVPIAGPGQINELVRGPAYVWAILHDHRISRGAW